jgi:hypothetical protein
MIFGIQARQSVRLTEIGRALEERIPLRKTQYRLCRQLKREGLWERLIKGLGRLAASRIEQMTLLILDITEISKKYASKMEHLARVRDGSEGELALGYWMCQVIAAETGERAIVPLYNRLYSQRDPEFRSENREIQEAMDTVDKHTGGRGVWVLDRGGDREDLLSDLMRKRRRFLVRLKGDRHLRWRGQPRSALELAQGCPMLYLESVIKEEGEKERRLHLEFGFRKVFLPGSQEPLYLVIVRGFGQEPMMLLTNVEMTKTRARLWWAVESYLTRWKIEETIRFIKQCYQLEDIRLLTYVRLQNMMALVMAVAFFAMAYLGQATKLRVLAGHVFNAARRLFGIPDFRFYALADGIKTHLFGQKRGLQGYFSALNPETGQRWLFYP